MWRKPFNEYLQAAVELGIPLAVCLLVVVVLCLYRGAVKDVMVSNEAILSLIFSFPLYHYLPVFIVTFGGLLVACACRCRPLAMVGSWLYQ